MGNLDDDDDAEFLASMGARRRTSTVAFLLAAVAVLSLVASAVMLATGRSLLWRGIGLVLAAVVAPVCSTMSVRTRARNSEELDVPKGVSFVLIVNAAAIGIALLHSVYVTRRFL